MKAENSTPAFAVGYFGSDHDEIIAIDARYDIAYPSITNVGIDVDYQFK